MSLKEIFTKNIGWKIGGLVLALALWFHLATEKSHEQEFTVEIEVSGLSDNLHIEKFVPPAAAVTVTGTGKQLWKLSVSEEMKLKVDLSAIKNPGILKHQFQIDDLYPFDPSQYQKTEILGNGIFDIHVVEK
ncbi:MAG: hypothetical protein V3W18_08720 [candidate division Zixibacteria bacterium]